eukprot:2981006-Rhodomonas_salina.2
MPLGRRYRAAGTDIRTPAQVSFEQVAGDLNKSLPRKKVVEYLNQVSAAVAYAHVLRGAWY